MIGVIAASPLPLQRSETQNVSVQCPPPVGHRHALGTAQERCRAHEHRHARRTRRDGGGAAPPAVPRRRGRLRAALRGGSWRCASRRAAARADDGRVGARLGPRRGAPGRDRGRGRRPRAARRGAGSAYAGGCLVLEAPRTAPPAVAEGDPFAAEKLDSALVVRPAVFGGGYALVLNKFPAFADHALLITAAAVPQARRLDRDDLDALHRCASVAARVQANFSWNLLDGVNNVNDFHAGGEGPRLLQLGRDGGRVAAAQALPNRTGIKLRRRGLGRGAAADFPRHRGVAARPLALVGPRALPARRADAAAARGRRARRRAPAAEGYVSRRAGPASFTYERRGDGVGASVSTRLTD